MARGSDLFRYSGMANPDITSGARLLLEGLGTPSDLVDKANVRQRLELQDLRQAKQDALATPGSPEWVAAQKAQQEMKMLDPMYSLEQRKLNQQIAGTPEYIAAKAAELADYSARLEAANKLKKSDPAYQAQIDALNEAKKERIGRELLAKEIMGLPTEIVTKTEITPAQREAAKIGLESAAVVNAGDVYNREFAKLRTPVTVSEPVLVEGYEVTPGKTTVMSEEEAHQEALKRAGLLDVVAGKAPVINEGLLPKVGVTESTKTLTAEELTQAKINATIKAAQEGKVSAALALEVANKLNPVKTSKEKIDEAELVLKQQEFLEKQSKNYYGKSGGSGKGNWIKTYDAMIATYGDPGKYDRPAIEKTLSDLQGTQYSDSEMSDAIDSARGIYGGSLVGVDENGFTDAVKTYLLKLPPKENKK